MLKHIRSALDEFGLQTKLSFETDTAHINSIQVVKPPTKKDAEQPKFTLSPSKSCVFTIVLHRFDLSKQKRVGTPVRYTINSRRSYDNVVVVESAGKLDLDYKQVKTSSGKPPMNVRLTFTSIPPKEPGKGWIDLDIEISPIPTPDAKKPHIAWEIEVAYPQVVFVDTDISGHVALNPDGLLGNPSEIVKARVTKDNPNPVVESPMTVQFGALYKTAAGTAGFTAQGIIFSGDDRWGNWKQFNYAGAGATPPATKLFCQITSPIHFMRLQPPSFFNPGSYTLSGGQQNMDGLKGGGMHFRLRAFHLESKANNPLDWYDVADFYRRWLRAKQSTDPTFFYKKEHAAAARGPLQQMAPHTVISNYGVDGAADPPPPPPSPPDEENPPEPRFPRLHQWLEHHPVKDGDPDWPGNANDSLLKVLNTIRGRFGSANVALEAQIWGFEMGGLYRYVGGFPPTTDALREPSVSPPAPSRLKEGLDQLLGSNIVPIATTDPLWPVWDMRRFRGHRIDGVEAITEPFPAQFKGDFYMTCATLEGSDDFGVHSNRIFVVESCTDGADDSARFLAARKRAADGRIDDPGNPRIIGGNRLYPYTRLHVCPEDAIVSLYQNEWVSRLFGYGFRLIEFMVQPYWDFYCYDAAHAAHGEITSVLGRGSWYVARMRELLSPLRGLAAVTPFALVHEFPCPEQLLPYIDEVYVHGSSSIRVWYGDSRSTQLRTTAADLTAARHVPVYKFMLSERLSEKMNLADNRPHGFPGYREVLIDKTPPSLPDHMLSAARDADTAAVTFDSWRDACITYFKENFDAEKTEHGLAPRDYALCGGGTYSYSRCVVNVFNLRSELFRLGMAAVSGERMLVHSILFERPMMFDGKAKVVKDYPGVHPYDEPVIDMAVRCAQLQMTFSSYFVGGRMAGQVLITGGNRTVFAWRAHRRSFIDVQELVDSLSTADERSTTDAKALKLSLVDFISRGVDLPTVTPCYDPDAYAPHEKSFASLIRTDMIQHMVWRKDMSSGYKCLYVFANVGNTSLEVGANPLTFKYTRGIDAKVNASAGWKKRAWLFDGPTSTNPKGKQLSASADGDAVQYEADESISLPARSLLAIELFKPATARQR